MSVCRAREFVGSELAGQRLPHRLPQLVDDVALVISELATNAVVHARTPFSVTMKAFDGSLLLLVSDDCPLVPSRAVAGHLDTSGRGLMIVEMVTLSWGVAASPGGTKSVWARFAWT